MGFRPVAALFVMVVMGSPFGHMENLNTVSPLTVATLFLREQVGKGTVEPNGPSWQALQLLLVPGHMWREAWRGDGKSYNELHAAALDTAAENGDWWETSKRQDFYLTGSTFCIFG